MINQHTFLLLDELASIPKGAGSREAKLNILKNNKEDLHEFMDIAFNPYRVFGISKLPKKSIGNTTNTDFSGLCKYLEEGRTRGQDSNEVKQHAKNIISAYPETAQLWLEQALLKKVRVGVEVKTLNKAGYNIPTFDCLLAAPNKENSLEGTTYPCYVQAKFDGVRCIRMPDGTFFGRNGKPVPNVRLAEHVKIDTDYVLDGEFYSHTRSFNEIIGYFSKDDMELPDDIIYVVFNAIHLDDWQDKEATVPYNEQLEIIDSIGNEGTHIESVSKFTAMVKDEVGVYAHFKLLMENGFEGAMVRNLDSVYSWKRVKVKDGILTKLKPFDHADCKITGFYEGENRNEGRLGGFILNYNGVEVKCGGGFSDEMREDYYSRANEFVGKWCRVKYTEITEDGSLRFPIWDSLREDKE